MRLFMFLAVFVALSKAQPAPADPKPIRLEGRTISLSGDAIRKATARLQSSGQPVAAANGQVPAGYSQTTDDAGKFAFDNVAPGRYTLSADKPGFLPARY